MASTQRRGARRLAAAVCLLAVACAGCQLRLAVDVEVNRDGGGVFSLAVGADEELLAAARQAGADPLTDLVQSAGELDGGWRVTEDTDDQGGRTVTLSAAFDDPEQLEALTRDVSTALNADEATFLQPFTAELIDGEIRVAGEASALPRRAVRDYGLSPRAAVRRIQRADAFDYAVTLTMPAEVTSANATRTDGRRLLWEVAPGEEVEISAVGVRPGPPILRAIAGAAAGAVIAALLLWVVARRRRRTL